VLAEIVSGERDWADVLFLIAVILFAVAAVIRFQAKAFDSALIALALGLVAFGWLLL
jgi:hypothetical protein